MKPESPSEPFKRAVTVAVRSLAAEPELVEKAHAIFKDAHVADPNWPMRSQNGAKKAKQVK